MTEPSDADPRHAEFKRLVLDRLDQAERSTGHLFKAARDLIEERGAVQAARILLNPNQGKLHDGLQILCGKRLGHLSVEQAVIDCPDKTIFSVDERSTAQTRLYYANKNADSQI